MTSNGWNFGTGSMADINKGMLQFAKDKGVSQRYDVDPNSADLSQYQRNLGDTGLQQAKFNRPNTSGPFGSSTVDANGNINSQFTGAFGQLNNNLTNQAANVAANPMDWGQFGTLGTGEAAGKEAAQASYNQSLSRLNPFWQKSENKLRTNMFQSGMGDSTAADTSMGEFGQARNDAYSGAMTGALQSGMQAQQNAFNGNLASRQQGVANALRGQMQPFEDMAGMQGFMTQPQVGRDNSMMVRDAAVNQMAPISAWADKERAMTARMGGVSGQFEDSPFDNTPGGGERRRKIFESFEPGQREFFNNFFGGKNLKVYGGEG